MCLKQHHWIDEEKKGGGNTDIHSIIQTPSDGHSISLVATHKYKHICKSGRRRASRDQPNPSHPIPYLPSFSCCNYSPSINRKLHRTQIPARILFKLGTGILKRPPRPRPREIHQIVRPQTPHPPGWLNTLVGGEVRQYVLRARGETPKCAGDAAGAEHEKVAQEPFEG